jgi:hypothetical protein
MLGNLFDDDLSGDAFFSLANSNMLEILIEAMAFGRMSPAQFKVGRRDGQGLSGVAASDFWRERPNDA